MSWSPAGRAGGCGCYWAGAERTQVTNSRGSRLCLAAWVRCWECPVVRASQVKGRFPGARQEPGFFRAPLGAENRLENLRVFSVRAPGSEKSGDKSSAQCGRLPQDRDWAPASPGSGDGSSRTSIRLREYSLEPESSTPSSGQDTVGGKIFLGGGGKTVQN